jgi:hypothetical protein
VIVQDDVAGLRAGIPLHWGLITGAKIALSTDGRTATLTEKGRTLRVEIMAPSDGAMFTVGSTEPPTGARTRTTAPPCSRSMWRRPEPTSDSPCS